MKTIKATWRHEPTIETPITSEIINAANIVSSRIGWGNDVCCVTPIIPKDKLVPLVCERCGGSIDKTTLKCEHCGTQYEWR